jgi:hypothetical protein
MTKDLVNLLKDLKFEMALRVKDMHKPILTKTQMSVLERNEKLFNRIDLYLKPIEKLSIENERRITT